MKAERRRDRIIAVNQATPGLSSVRRIFLKSAALPLKTFEEWKFRNSFFYGKIRSFPIFMCVVNEFYRWRLFSFLSDVLTAIIELIIFTCTTHGERL